MKSLLSRTKKALDRPSSEPSAAGASSAGGSPATAADRCGLSNNTLHANGIAFGLFPEYGQYGARDLNALLPSPMAIIGDYVQISDSDMEMKQVDWHLDDVLACPDAVWAIALMPQSGCETFDAAKAETVAQKMAEVNRKGRTVWLRFGHEMNGDWYRWGRRPKPFIAAWRLLAEAVRRHTANLPAKTYLLWAPNIFSSTSGSSGYKDTTHRNAQYWPGRDFVDICGLSIYVYDKANNAVPSDSFARRFSDFYKLYAIGEGKPITLAETSAPFRFEEDSQRPLGGSADEIDIKMSWLEQIVGKSAASKFPLLRSVIWFNYLKNEEGQTRDFRVLRGRPEVAQAFSAAMERMR